MRAVWFIGKFELRLNCTKHPNYSPKSRTPQQPQNVSCNTKNEIEMTNPEDIIAKTIGEIFGKIIEKSVDLGDKFIKHYFKNHKDKVIENAEKNATEFLNLLALKVMRLEQTITDNEIKTKIEKNYDSPDFSKVLEHSIKISSLSEETDKKDILANLLIQRLFVDTDTTDALVIKIACEKLEYLNGNHLKILGLIHLIKQTSRDLDYYNNKRPSYTDDQIKKILLERFAPYYKITVNEFELEHLETHDCLKLDYSLTTFLSPLIIPFELYSNNDQEVSFYKTKLGNQIGIDWTTNNLQNAELSILGQLIAEKVNDLMTKKK